MLYRGYSPLYTGHFRSNDYCRVCAVIVVGTNSLGNAKQSAI